jgi:hypothetical protein
MTRILGIALVPAAVDGTHGRWVSLISTEVLSAETAEGVAKTAGEIDGLSLGLPDTAAADLRRPKMKNEQRRPWREIGRRGGSTRISLHDNQPYATNLATHSSSRTVHGTADVRRARGRYYPELAAVSQTPEAYP